MWTIVATAIGSSKCIGSRAGACSAGGRLMNSRFKAKIEATAVPEEGTVRGILSHFLLNIIGYDKHIP
jgi:hypothetical protein